MREEGVTREEIDCQTFLINLSFPYLDPKYIIGVNLDSIGLDARAIYGQSKITLHLHNGEYVILIHYDYNFHAL